MAAASKLPKLRATAAIPGAEAAAALRHRTSAEAEAEATSVGDRTLAVVEAVTSAEVAVAVTLEAAATRVADTPAEVTPVAEATAVVITAKTTNSGSKEERQAFRPAAFLLPN
jgi:hypothetical protein